MSRLELCADDKASDFEAESEAPICMTEEDMAQNSPARAPEIAVRAVLAPLALAQFICSFAGSNMNVMINDIQRGPGHDGAGRPDRHYDLFAGHGSPDDPLRQIDRSLRAQAASRLGSFSTESEPCSARSPQSRHTHHRQLHPGRCRHRAAHPAGLHTATCCSPRSTPGHVRSASSVQWVASVQPRGR